MNRRVLTRTKCARVGPERRTSESAQRAPKQERSQTSPHFQTLLRQLPRPFTFKAAMAVSTHFLAVVRVELTVHRASRVGVHLLCAQRSGHAPRTGTWHTTNSTVERGWLTEARLPQLPCWLVTMAGHRCCRGLDLDTTTSIGSEARQDCR